MLSATQRRMSVVSFLGALFLTVVLGALLEVAALSANSGDEGSNPSGSRGSANPSSRRDVLSTGGSIVAGGLVCANYIFPCQEAAAADDTQSLASVAVVGASGRTGALCVASCLKQGIPVRALTRTGSWTPPEVFDDVAKKNQQLLTVTACDVKDPDALLSGVSGCRSVIYAASASKKGGNPKEIDNNGVVAAGDACIKAKVGSYVVISSTAVTRPKSLGYIFTDVSVNGIMGEKRKGEDGVKELYAHNDGSRSSSYVIIRPGGLEEPKNKNVLGPSTLELSQGDAIAGIVSRADLAEVAVQAGLSNSPNLRNTAFEIYYTDSAQPCERRFKSLLTNGEVQRVHGDTYEALFQGMKPDGEYYIPA
mmetsp:Transcript_26922/g.41233  ORF Transcript_26922/g.41233 Transcript_26922/m.41233 type:complete len:365 (+) Transcript_26922:70-1164(+)